MLKLHVPVVYDLDSKGIDYHLEEPAGAKFVQFEFRDAEKKCQLNIGVLSYTERQRPGRAVKYYVDDLKLRPSRFPALRNWSNSLAEKHAYRLRPASIYEEYNKFSRMIFWCDDNGYHRVLDNIEDFHEALVAYSHFLSGSIAPGGNRNFKQRLLVIAVDVASAIFENDSYNLRLGVKFPGYNKSEQVPTQAPSDEHLLPVYKVVNDVFRTIHDFLQGGRETPALYECHDERFWITPCYYPFISETAILEYQVFHTPGKLLNAVRQLSLEMVAESDGGLTISDAISEVMEDLSKGHEIKEANDTGHFIKLKKDLTQEEIHRLAILAHDCFVFMILLNTGSNSAPLANIQWDADSTVEVEAQRMRSIKHRTGSQVEIVFGARFFRRFREYIQIRNELPGISDFKYLFASFAKDRHPLQLGQNLSTKFRLALRRLVNPDIGSVGFRELRAYHHVKKSKQSGFDVAANSAQHTITTAIASYTAGNIQENIDQAVMYFTAFGGAVAEFADELTQAGGCSAGLIKAVPIEDAVITPDCKNMMGCLFCEHYLLHFNSDDARKLLSIEYVVEQLRQVQFDHAEFTQVYGPTLARVSWLLNSMANYSADLRAMIDRTRKDVFDNENLNAYWQKKLNILVNIGVL